jgi:hypothetical protein
MWPLKKNNWESIAASRKWGEDKINDPETKDLFSQVVKYADEMHKFYFNHVRSKRALSILIRFFAISLFGYSLFLTLKLSFTPDSEELMVITCNMGSIALASILLMVDRVFSLSDSWIRYTQARFEIEKIVSDFHSQFLKLVLMKDTEVNHIEDTKAIIDVLSNFDKTLRMVITEETSVWKTNLTAELTALKTKIDTELTSKRQDLDTKQKEFNKEKIDNAKKHEDSLKTGILIISIGYANILDGNLVIDKKKYELMPNQNTIAIPELKQGDYILNGTLKLKADTGTDNQKIIPINTAVNIISGINNFTLPK